MKVPVNNAALLSLSENFLDSVDVLIRKSGQQLRFSSAEHGVHREEARSQEARFGCPSNLS